MKAAIRLVGPPGTGKTTLRTYLAERLAIPSFGIDEVDRNWYRMKKWVEQVPVCIVEGSGITPAEQALFKLTPTFTILCLADRKIREQRLRQRPEAKQQPSYVRKLAGYGAPAVKPQAVLQANGPWRDEDLAELVARCRVFLERLA